MTKLLRYMKPFLSIFLAGVLLLLGQAFLELNLPNLMSKIVDVGIQKGGIEESAPQVVSADYLEALKRFMPEDQQALVERSYTTYANTDQQVSLGKRFPSVTMQTMVRAEAKEESAALDAAFKRADYAFVAFAQTFANLSGAGTQISSSNQNTANFDLDALNGMLPLLEQVPQSVYDEAVEAAANTQETMLGNVASVLNKAFYQSFGADLGSIQTGYIVKTGGIMLLLCLASVVCAAGAGLSFSRLGAGVARDLRLAVYTKVSEFTNNEMDQFSTASLITRTTNDITQVQMVLTMGVRMLCFAPLMGIGGIVMALKKSSGMAWIIAVAVLVIVGTIAIIFSIAMPRFKIMQKLLDRLNLVSRENLSGMMVIRAFATQKFEENRFDQANKDLSQNNLFVNRTISIMMPVMTLVMNGIALFIVWMGGQQIAQSQMQVGDMLAFIQYAMQIIMSFLMISMMFIMLPRASVSATRIHEVLASEPSVKDPEAPNSLGKRAKGVLTFHDVSFRYDGADEYVLHNISFTAKPGQTTALIGPTGSGKSTLVNLVPRFYDVTEGDITLDGIDIRSLSQHELRNAIGYVPQKGTLFTGDIAYNLRYGDPNANDATLREAAEVAQATEFLEKLPEGLETAISQGGTNVSGGQRQRLSIARALVRKAPIYIFDDSFSALDFATDARLRKALVPYTEDAAVLLVAQRVSTIMQADQIIVLDQGRVAGIGTHRELLKTCPTYREIAQSQLSKEELE